MFTSLTSYFKSSNHSVGRQVLNLDFHFGLTGSPRGGLSRTSNRVSVVPAFNAALVSLLLYFISIVGLLCIFFEKSAISGSLQSKLWNIR